MLPWGTSVTVVVVSVDAVIASEKVAVTVVPTATPVAPSAGVIAVTVGGVVSTRRRERPHPVGRERIACGVLRAAGAALDRRRIDGCP